MHFWILGPLASLLIGRFGCGMTILFGSVMTAAGIGLSSLATGVKLLVAVFGVLAGEEAQHIIITRN